MIVLRMMGGLGNQLFEYALYTSLQQKRTDVRLDYRSLFLEMDRINRETIFDVFQLDRPYPSATGYGNIRKKMDNFISRVCWKLFKTFQEQEDGCFYPQVLKMQSGWLQGYWQSPKYFADCEQELRERLRFKGELGIEGKQILQKIREATCPVSIHIRLGDYTDEVNNALFGNICTPAYYEEAIRRISDLYEDPTFFIFSNEPQKAKELIHVPNCVVVDIHDESVAWADMYLMSRCHHNIIANSSFSWWAAWLNTNKDKTVIAPGKWINGKKTPDIWPDSWQKIPIPAGVTRLSTDAYRTPVLSIITVSYQAQDEIEETIRSVLSQDFTDYEYIFIDGASSDHTVEIIESYREQFEAKGVSYRVISEPDHGIYDAMNKGVTQASGKWVLMLNAGDALLHSQVLSEFLSVPHSDGKIIYGDAVDRARFRGRIYYKYSKSRPLENICHSIPFCHQSVFVPLELMRRYGFDSSLRIAADYKFFSQICRDGAQFLYHPKAVVLYDYGGISSTALVQSAQEHAAIHREFYPDVEQPEPPATSGVMVKVKGWIKRILPGIAYSPARGWNTELNKVVHE